MLVTASLAVARQALAAGSSRLPERGSVGAPADGSGARVTGGPGDDQAAGRDAGAAALDVLPHVPGEALLTGRVDTATVDEIERIVI